MPAWGCGDASQAQAWMWACADQGWEGTQATVHDGVCEDAEAAASRPEHCPQGADQHQGPLGETRVAMA